MAEQAPGAKEMKPCGSAGPSRREFQAYLSINPTTRDHICSLTINGASQRSRRIDVSILLGVGVTTYNRRASLENTVEKIRRHTRSPHLLAVADDGSTDGSVEYLAAQHIVTISGIDRGIAWNKNRLLYLFNNIAKCDVIILIEDDTYPVEDGWEEPRVRASLLHGHINLAGDWFRSHCMSGAGTPGDPLLCPHTSGQGFSRESINVVGFMDTRYRRYGYEPAEHSIRMIKAGFGGHFHPDTPNRPSHRRSAEGVRKRKLPERGIAQNQPRPLQPDQG